MGNLGDLPFCDLKNSFWKGSSLSYSAAISKGSEIINLSARKALVDNIHCYKLNVCMWVIKFPQPWGEGVSGRARKRKGGPLNRKVRGQRRGRPFSLKWVQPRGGTNTHQCL